MYAQPNPVMTPRSHNRASSVPSSAHTPMTTTPRRISTTFTPVTAASAAHAAAHGTGRDSSDSDQSAPAARNATILQPRVAVLLNVPRKWHPWLFALRLASILPAIRWGTPSVLRLAYRVLELLLDDDHDGYRGHARAAAHVYGHAAHAHVGSAAYPLTETALASIWCFASGYLSFFFTDCLMSRWLINYTPQATVVRLITINAINAYSTSILLTVAGGFQDARLLLPGWIGIATTLTVCYHLVHQKINIRKETSTSVNVFSIASYLSMLTLLAHLHNHQQQPAYPKMPLIHGVETAWDHAYRIWNQAKDSFEHREL